MSPTGKSSRVWLRLVLRLIVILATCTLASCNSGTASREPLTEVYSPVFRPVPPPEPLGQTVRTLTADWRGAPGDALRADLLSWQAGAAASALLVILIVAVDYRAPLNPRNVDLLLMWIVGASFFNSMRFFDRLDQRAYLNLLDGVFITVFVCSGILLLRCIYLVIRPARHRWTPNPGTRGLAALALALLALNLGLSLRAPDDAGWFANLGAQRLRERGLLPYGDPLLTSTPGAAYGPLLYAAHVPFQIGLSPRPVNATSPARPRLGENASYYLPPALATQLCTAAFHLLGVASLFVASRRLVNARVAWGIVCLYTGSLAVLGIGGNESSVAGITFVSHIAPAGMTLLAFATLSYPGLAGALLVLAAGVGFYPAFMGPAWLGYYWRRPDARRRFILACVVTSVTVGGAVYALSRPADGRSRLGTIIHDTFGHHTDPRGYGASPFGFWGQRAGLRQSLMTPLAGSTFTTPAWLALLGLIAGSFVLARGRPAGDLALLSASIAIAATLVKPHATGTYMAWYYGLLLIGLLTPRATAETAAPSRPRGAD